LPADFDQRVARMASDAVEEPIYTRSVPTK